MKRILCVLLFVFGLLTSAWADSSRYASESVLNSGKWVKIQVAEDGIYKLTAADLKKMGFSNLDKVAVYGYGGWPLDEDFSTTYIDDVPEVAVWRGADYLLFYGKGPRKWEYSSSDKSFIHTNNPYSNYGYYFVTEKETTGRTMEKAASAAGATLQVTTFDDYVLHEEELVSVNSSGRELYGESFTSTLSRDFTISVPGITNDEGKATLSFISRGNGTITMNVDGNALISGSVSVPSDEYEVARELYRERAWMADKGETVKVNIGYSTTGHKNVHLNYFRLQMKRQLKVYDNYTFFRSLSARGNASRFVIQGADASTLVFDVTDGVNPQQMETSLNGTELSFSIPASASLREFVVVKPSQIKAPVTIGEVANQNLHALPQQDMIIIAQPNFTTQAERLAEAHRTKDNLTVRVVTPESIYNEFSSGTPDATAYRRFMKMFYDRKTSEADAPKYLLLFGDGSFDNRKLTSAWKSVDMSNMLLTYQTENSLSSQSYVIDDYFGFLDDADNKKSLQNKKLCLGIGRFPIRTVEQATQMVDKVISYMENKNTGSWKNNLCFMADDGSNTDGFMTEHMEFADQLAGYVESEHPEFLVNKLYYDAYKKDMTAGTYPDVRSGLQKLLKDGLLLFNYTGHGGTTALSDEKVLTQTDINQFTYTHLPVWVTATCDFTRFDDLNTSAGEDVFLNKSSGGIALFTTVRVAYSRPNFPINDNVIRNLFERNNGRRRTLGEVMQATKNTLSSVYKLGFCLIGDPAVKMAYPEFGMKVTTVNGQSVDGNSISFKALEKITVEGEVLDVSGQLVTDFTGIVNPTVKDSKVTVTCLKNSNKDDSPAFTFTDYPNTIFIGNDSVRNGKFSFTFTVPKDISYSNLQGKMNLYAVDTESGNEAQGNFDNFIVGGTSDTAETDTIGPEIRALYLNDTTFVDGGQVNTTPYFVAELWDKSGVNITGSSVGHDMMLVIDESTVLSYNLNSYYELLPGEDGTGIVKFPIPALEPGKHTAEFWVWDILNNSTVRTFTFEVVEGLKPFLFDVIATPGIAREQVTFHLMHNRPESRMRVGIMVYDLAGRQLWKHEESGTSGLFENYTVSWDLTSGGARMRPGVYIYRAAISTDNSKDATKARKFIILGE
ncbi:type IX secretion system sortase PorU [Parabacteroides merdae]|uniref:type IX secretion system sortase PorU n=1 Tax=Parabacteroides merdae TaxID=46503 RepID=UPI001D06AEB4|nr:type IX secretion system sortase PorU [Parabacteroides merdae]MCB6303793.1 type IX secretion system sortase PorU [Parabacteroides merdae]MCG4889853.1 type IX secretion system sortase PorU [Parabacteroides merdae]MCG4934350.1 type IX secretion system sortase PorU [Parabacteroides merdae]MCQ5221681.1 type IX secretion system sortase PorU [Parabacteroides merdae]